MRIVIDTNVLLMALPSKSPFHPIIQNFNERKYNLVISSEIFMEYEEILSTKGNILIAANILNSFLEAPNIIPVDIYFKWNLITVDPDDNKFTNAYLASQADYLVTTDQHFDEVKRKTFPQVTIISPTELLNILK